MDQPPHDLGRTVNNPHGWAAQDLSNPQKIAAEDSAAGFKCQKGILICHALLDFKPVGSGFELLGYSGKFERAGLHILAALPDLAYGSIDAGQVVGHGLGD